jgi:predicted dehydrogenase
MLVEKPVARSAGEARALAREVARSRTPAYANLFLRQLPALARLRAVLRADVLGRVTAVGASYLTPTALNGAGTAGASGWMQDARRAGGGGIVDLGIPLVDALTALGARPRLDALRLDRRRGDRTDAGGAAVGTWGDVPLSLRVSWAVRPGGLEVVVNGAGGTAVLRDGALELSGDLGAPERWIGAPPDPAEAVRAFFARLRSRRLAANGLEDAIRAHEVIERAAAL